MAYYVWLDSDFYETVNGRQWPNQIDVWTDQVEPIVHKQGWQVVPGSSVVDNIPWRHLPATLYRVEVEEPVSEDMEHSAWAKAMLVERYGTLRVESAKRAALSIMTQIVAYHQHPSFYRGSGTVAQLDELARIVTMGRKFLEGNGPSPLKHAINTGYRPIIMMSKALEAPSTDLAWVFAASIATHLTDKALKLDMARALSEVLE